MAKKISIGSWAYAFGPYEDNPIDLDTVIRRLGELEFDGIELCGFPPHATPDDYPTPASRRELADKIDSHGLGISGYAANFMDCPPGLPDAEQGDAYVKLFDKNVQFCVDVGSPAIRVDTVSPPPSPEAVSYDEAWARIVKLWTKCAEMAQQAGIKMVWEFEPGFAFNKPSEIVKLVNDVGHPNFSTLYDSCHAHMVSVIAARQSQPKETLPGGAVELAQKLSGHIGHVHLIDSDNTLHGDETSTHAPFGQGVLDFDQIMPAIEAAGYDSDWWAVDLCFWPQAWEATEAAKKFVDQLNEKYG